MDYSRKWWALAAVSSGVIMSTIDGSIVNIALNTLITDFHTNLNVVEWVLLSYLLSITCLLLLVGRLGDMFGKRRIYIAGFVVFTLSSALCGISPTIGALIGFRVLQGVGAAMVQALGPALIVLAFPPKERGTALGTIGSAVALGIMIGPVLGGLLISTVGWRSIFYVNIPIGMLGVWLSLTALPPDAVGGKRHRFDFTGAGLLLVSLLALLLALSEGRSWGWGDGRTLGLLAASVLGGGLFTWWEWRTPEPMLNLRMFRSLAFSFNLLAGFILFIGMAFNLLLTPLMLQLVFQLDLRSTGFMLISLPLALSLASPISGRLSDRIGPRVLTIVGLVLIGVSFIAMTFVYVDTSLVYVVGVLMLLGLGIGLFQSPNNSVVLSSAPPEALGVASGVLAVMRTLGQTAGVPIAETIWASRVVALVGAPIEPLTSAAPTILAAAFNQTMIVAAVLAFLAIIPSVVGGQAVAVAVRGAGVRR